MRTFMKFSGMVIIFAMLLTGYGGGGESQAFGLELTHSSVFSDTENTYATGGIVGFDHAPPPGASNMTSGTIPITSASTSNTTGEETLSSFSLDFLGRTKELQETTNYKVALNRLYQSGETYTENAQIGATAINPPAINKLVSDVDLRVSAQGLPVKIIRTYLLDSTYFGPLGYGWTHNYRMRIVAHPIAKGVLPGQVEVFNADGTGSFFTPDGSGAYLSPAGDFRKLTMLPNGVYQLKGKYGTIYSFSSNGKLFLMEDSNANAVFLQYNIRDRLQAVIDASGQATIFTYDGLNRIVSITDPAGRSVTYSYDAASNLASVTDIGGSTTTYSYDLGHNLTKITDPSGRRTFFTTDANDRLASVSGEGGSNRLSFQYGVPAPDKMQIIDAAGNRTKLTYDNNALVTQIVDASGNITRKAYDADFNLVSLTNAAGGVTTLTYDANGNVLSTTDPQGNSISLTYEAVFNKIASLTDAKGNITIFNYDATGNLISMIYPDGSQESFSYDTGGNLISKTDRSGHFISYSYDLEGRLTGKSFPDGTFDNFTYDPAGNLTAASDENGMLIFTYDGHDRLTSVVYPGGEKVSYAYGATGNRTRITYPNGRTFRYAYDAVGRLTRISTFGMPVVNYGYDALSRVTKRTLLNGIFTRYRYDASSRLLLLINRHGAGPVISGFKYTYDNVGNRLTKSTLSGTTQYTYDAVQQLTDVTLLPGGAKTRYNLDGSGNRTSVVEAGTTISYTTNNLNQYTSIGGDTYTYDANGNLASKTIAGVTSTYTYDLENRLVQVLTPAGTITYTYDPFGRRTSKSTSAGTTRYIYDGSRVIMEEDGAGSIKATYIQGRWIDEVLVMNRGGVNYFYTQDGLGSVSDLTDTSGNVIESYTYDAYGTPSSTSAVGNPYLFTGREYEAETGLYYYRARYYEPGIGRFISEDPLGLLGGVNLYSYVSNNPANISDALGLYGNLTGLIDLHPSFGTLPERLPRFGMVKKWIDFAKDIYTIGQFLYLNYELFKVTSDLRNALDYESELTRDPRRDPTPDNSQGNGKTDKSGDPGRGNSSNTNCAVDPAKCTCQERDPQMCMAAADPTFVQASRMNDKRESKGMFAGPLETSTKIAQGLHASISVPYKDALVRGNVPFFGLAYGKEFKQYRLEYGEGPDPVEWHRITGSTTPQEKKFSPSDIDDSGDMTIHGSLGTWDTGLKNYVYLPSYPANHPVNLKGVYTIRLLVTGKDGRVAEDRVTLHVANVVPNAWGGFVRSKDERVTLTVPEQAIMDSFRLISIEAVDKAPAGKTDGRELVGRVYHVREPGEEFSKEATLHMAVSTVTGKKIKAEHLGIYGYDTRNKSWVYLDTAKNGKNDTLVTKVTTLYAYYAVMAGDKPGEGSVTTRSESDINAPQLLSAGSLKGPYLVKNTFEDGQGQWANRDGLVGAEVSIDDTATFDGTKALKITNLNKSGNFAVNVLKTSFDVRDYPIVRFDYRIAPGVKTNILVKVTGRWYEVGFTDDAKDLLYKRVNIAHIGDIKDVNADDRWHTARFNLYDMLRTRTGHTVVDKMIMADWDVPGYMKLDFGKNAKGATYYVDNFSISREVDAGLRLSGETVIVDNFNQKKSTNALGGENQSFFERSKDDASLSFSNDDASDRGHSLKISYNVTEPGSYAGYLTRLEGFDFRGYQALTFKVKGLAEGEDIRVGLRDGSGHESKVFLTDYLVKKNPTGWGEVTVPLAAFRGTVLKGIENLSFSVEHRISSTGTVLLDDIEFHRELVSIMVDDFEREDRKNHLGRDLWTMASGAAAINGGHTRGSPNGIYMISYGGNIGLNRLYATEVKSYAGWGTDLGGIDCSRCDTLSFDIRGARGGENPSVYLSDGNFRWGVETAWYARVTDDWLRVVIPMSDFRQNGVDTTHLTKLQLVFEGIKMSGTIYIDNIRLGRQPE